MHMQVVKQEEKESLKGTMWENLLHLVILNNTIAGYKLCFCELTEYAVSESTPALS